MSFRTAWRWAGAAVLVASLSACGLGDDVASETANPCDLLTAADVQAATGQATEEGMQVQDVCVWSTDGGGKLSAGVLQGGDELFQSSIRASTEGGSQVGGVGDKAFFFGNTQLAFIQVLQGETNMRLDYSGPGAPGEAEMTDLARKAVERL